ncbi:MAG: hypothetical protein J7L88_03970 [Thermoplasmata archaeon]|nr:hypothetical protein [Thermoplasmata archaeon]
MAWKVLATISLILLLVISTTLCVEEKKEKPELKGPWRDLTDLRVVLNSLSTLPLKYVPNTEGVKNIKDPYRTLYVLVGLDMRLSGEEVLALKEYYSSGGHIIIADDGNFTEDLVQIFGVKLWCKPYRPGWRYTDDWVKNLSFIKGVGEINGKNYTVLVHKPLGMNLTEEWKTVLALPHYATIELNGDNKESMGDAFFMVAPIAGEIVNENGGTFLFVSSSGLFTDNVFTMYDNKEFLEAYIKMVLPGGGIIYMDDTKQTKGISPHNVLLEVE